MTSEFVIARVSAEVRQRRISARFIPAHPQKLLAKEGLASDRKGRVMRLASDASYLEVFKWTSTDSSRLAHGNGGVTALWTAMAECADMISLSMLPVAVEVFSPLNRSNFDGHHAAPSPPSASGERWGGTEGPKKRNFDVVRDLRERERSGSAELH